MKKILKAPPRRNPAQRDAPAKRPNNAMTRADGRLSPLQTVMFFIGSYGLIFAMCATGRAGA